MRGAPWSWTRSPMEDRARRTPASCRADQDCALRSESRKCHDGATLELCPLPLAANATEAVLADLRKYDSYWTPAWCTTASPSGSASDLCPAVAEQFGCRSVYALDEIGAWLREDVRLLVCVICDAEGQDGEAPCACDQGLTFHQAGLTGVLCDRLLVGSDAGPSVLDSAGALASHALPPYTPEAALAYVELLEPRVHHVFDGYRGNPTKVASWLDIEPLGCTKARLEGTTVPVAEEPMADFTEASWIVSTYRFPDWNGCTDVTLEHVVYRVWPSYGEVGIDPYVVEPVCFGHVAYED